MDSSQSSVAHGDFVLSVDASRSYQPDYIYTAKTGVYWLQHMETLLRYVSCLGLITVALASPIVPLLISGQAN